MSYVNIIHAFLVRGEICSFLLKLSHYCPLRSQILDYISIYIYCQQKSHDTGIHMDSSVAKITFVAAEITFEVAMITSS